MTHLNERNREPKRRPEECITNEGAAMPNYVMSQTASKTKGTEVHIGQLGAMYGMLKDIRMPSQTAHANHTAHLLDFTSWISTPLAEGLSNPIEFWYAEIARAFDARILLILYFDLRLSA